MAKSSIEQLAPGVFVLPGMPKPPELPPDLLPPPSDPLPLRSAPKHLIRWGIAGAVALVTLIGTMLLWMSSSGEVPVPTHLVSRLPPPTVPIVMVLPHLPPAPPPSPPPPQDMMAQWWAAQKPHLPVTRHHRLATFHWHGLGHSKTQQPDPETLRLNQQQLPDKLDEVGP